MLALLGVAGVVLGQGYAEPRRAAPNATTPHLATPHLAPFSSQRPGAAVPQAWTPLIFRNIARHTVYTLVDDVGTTVLRADAQSSASGLMHAVDVEADAAVALTWRWRTDALLPGSDLAKAATDDSPLRLQVSYRLDESSLTLAERTRIALARAFYGIDLPHSALVYVWDRTEPVGSVIANPTTDRARALVVESGTQYLGRWRSYRRDLRADYRRAFGTEPPRIASISLMTDSDDTGASITAFYGDVRIERVAPTH